MKREDIFRKDKVTAFHQAPAKKRPEKAKPIMDEPDKFDLAISTPQSQKRCESSENTENLSATKKTKSIKIL